MDLIRHLRHMYNQAAHSLRQLRDKYCERRQSKADPIQDKKGCENKMGRGES